MAQMMKRERIPIIILKPCRQPHCLVLLSLPGARVRPAPEAVEAPSCQAAPPAVAAVAAVAAEAAAAVAAEVVEVAAPGTAVVTDAVIEGVGAAVPIRTVAAQAGTVTRRPRLAAARVGTSATKSKTSRLIPCLRSASSRDGRTNFT